MMLLSQIAKHGDRILVTDAEGAYSAHELLAMAHALPNIPPDSVVALLARPGRFYVAGTLACWLKGSAVVPLCPDHPKAEMEHVIRDSGASCILTEAELSDRLPDDMDVEQIFFESASHEETSQSFFIPDPDPEKDALILYTSGTTGKPKGAVHKHRSVTAQVLCLAEAWEWTANDRILHFLPLHHTHGIINKLYCPLWSGARCDFMPSFDARLVWEKIIAGDYTVFMAVPSVYSRLVKFWEEENAEFRHVCTEACKRMRLMVCGSAALPVPVLEKWKSVSGHVLMERYGMTEIGMALSNPLHGERKPGFVGLPLPGVEVRITNETDEELPEGEAGELQVRGKNLFDRYLNLPEVTAGAFCGNWFRTGDAAVFEEGAYRILGRMSADIIKTGGYKVSAIEIENALLLHPAIAEIAVAAIEDESWGERVAAFVVLKENAALSLDELRSWCRERLAVYKIPSLLFVLDALPRNQMGKVLKPELKKIIPGNQ